MANWFHRFLNPHCPDCKLDSQDKKVCQSCETLRMEIARLTSDNERLLNGLLDKSITSKEEPKVPIMLKPPSNVPWTVRRQMLEREDRERARLIKDAPKPEKVDVSDLERELNIVEEKRDALHGSNA